MYIHPAFRINTEDAKAMLQDRGFGSLVVPTSGAPVAVHVPFLLRDKADGSLTIELHVARINPIHEAIGTGCKVLLICQGPDAYISPDWYNVPNQVPTWVYTAVHVTGVASVLAEAENLPHVDRLSAFFEQRLLPKKPWLSIKMDEQKRAMMMKAIVTIAIRVESIEGQKKLIQHKGETEHRGAIAGLRGRGDPVADAVAELIEGVVGKKFG